MQFTWSNSERSLNGTKWESLTGRVETRQKAPTEWEPAALVQVNYKLSFNFDVCENTQNACTVSMLHLTWLSYDNGWRTHHKNKLHQFLCLNPRHLISQCLWSAGHQPKKDASYWSVGRHRSLEQCYKGQFSASFTVGHNAATTDLTYCSHFMWTAINHAKWLQHDHRYEKKCKN